MHSAASLYLAPQTLSPQGSGVQQMIVTLCSSEFPRTEIRPAE